MLARGSVKIISPFMILGIVIFFLYPPLSYIIFGFAGYLFWFFRDPIRLIDSQQNEIRSAADGKIIFAERNESEIRIAVRMSPFDVHLNRSPIDGQVNQIKHKPGKHLSVYFGDVEKKNEQNLISIDNDAFSIDILQITGIFARRLETWVSIGDMIVQGQKIGIIRFGSQTNVFIKSKKDNKELKLKVNIGDKVKAGLTVLVSFED